MARLQVMHNPPVKPFFLPETLFAAPPRELELPGRRSALDFTSLAIGGQPFVGRRSTHRGGQTDHFVADMHPNVFCNDLDLASILPARGAVAAQQQSQNYDAFQTEFFHGRYVRVRPLPIGLFQ
jgi:hypothetical protein